MKNKIKQFKEREIKRVKQDYENRIHELVVKDVKRKNQKDRDQYQKAVGKSKNARNVDSN